MQLMYSTKCTITCWHYRLKWHYNFLLILYLNFSFDFRLFLLPLCLSVHDDALLWRLTSFYLKFISTEVKQYSDPGPHISINRLIIISYLPILFFFFSLELTFPSSSCSPFIIGSFSTSTRIHQQFRVNSRIVQCS